MIATIITTTSHNVGDDFVREGLLHLLSNAVPIQKVQLIHKHLPVTCRPEFDWFHHKGVGAALDRIRPGLGYRGSQMIDSVRVRDSTDRIMNCDLLVQSGAPVYWVSPDGTGCDKNEWWDPLIERRWKLRRDRKLFMNLAGGTCQPFGSDGSEFASNAKVLQHIQRFFDLTCLTTARDRLSIEVLKYADRSAALLPCTSLYAVDRLGIAPKVGKYVAMNYMAGGGHFRFGQPIDEERWKNTFVSLAKQIMREDRCLLVCHDQKELRLARQLLPEAETFYSHSFRDYLEVYAEAKYGVMNRVHGAFALASLGKESIVIGADSRARMAEQIGLACSFVNDVTTVSLLAECRRLSQSSSEYANRIERIKANAKAEYLQLMKHAIGSTASG